MLGNHGKWVKMERFFAILKMYLCRDTQLRLHKRKEHVLADPFKPRKLGGDRVQGGQRRSPRMGEKEAGCERVLRF